MIPVTAGFDAVTPPVSWEGLKKLNQPALPVLAKFVHRCSKDPATRTAAVTLLVTSLCQLTGRSMTARMPSTIVVNAHDLVPDATDLLASRMVLSVAGLAWHGLDFDAGCPQQKVARVLEYLRSREPMTKSELLRGAHLDKEERDIILVRLAAENLVWIEGKVVTATSYVEFVEGLYERKEFPEPKNHWEKVESKPQSAA